MPTIRWRLSVGLRVRWRGLNGTNRIRRHRDYSCSPTSMKLCRYRRPHRLLCHSARAIARGDADPTTYKVHVPAKVDVRAIRTKLRMSQNAFAARFGILPSTLRDWEQNRRHPDGAARVLLMVIATLPWTTLTS